MSYFYPGRTDLDRMLHAIVYLICAILIIWISCVSAQKRFYKRSSNGAILYILIFAQIFLVESLLIYVCKWFHLYMRILMEYHMIIIEFQWTSEQVKSFMWIFYIEAFYCVYYALSSGLYQLRILQIFIELKTFVPKIKSFIVKR